METSIITRVNNVDITATNNTEKLVPIESICDALGIDTEVQRLKIQEHSILSSTMVLSTIVAVDGVEHEKLCLPLMYVVGWIFSDDIRLVAAHDRVMELHNALLKYLNEERNIQIEKLQMQEQRIESLRREIAELEQCNDDEMILDEEA